MANNRDCVHCGHKFGFSEFIEHIIKTHDNRVYCFECQERNYIVGAGKSPLFKLLSFFLSLLWLPLGILAFIIFHKSAITPGVVVTSVGHFGFALLGALLGYGIGLALKQFLRWHFGHTVIIDVDGDYQM